MAPVKQDEEVKLTKADLLEIVKAARQAPEPSEDELEAREAKRAKRLQDMQDRKEMALLQKARQDNRMAEQKLCAHTRKNGSATTVLVKPDGNPQYLICQVCQAILRPAEQDRIYDTDIVNPQLFSKFLQMSQDSPIFS